MSKQPLAPTCGRRTGYKEVFGLLDCFTDRLFAHGQAERFTAATYCAFLATRCWWRRTGPSA